MAQVLVKGLASGQNMPNYEQRWFDDQASSATLVNTNPTKMI